jgi:hypothetical protein
MPSLVAWLLDAVLAAASFWLYSGSIDGDFVFDDRYGRAPTLLKSVEVNLHNLLKGTPSSVLLCSGPIFAGVGAIPLPSAGLIGTVL